MLYLLMGEFKRFACGMTRLQCWMVLARFVGFSRLHCQQFRQHYSLLPYLRLSKRFRCSILCTSWWGIPALRLIGSSRLCIIFTRAVLSKMTKVLPLPWPSSCLFSWRAGRECSSGSRRNGCSDYSPSAAPLWDSRDSHCGFCSHACSVCVAVSHLSKIPERGYPGTAYFVANAVDMDKLQ